MHFIALLRLLLGPHNHAMRVSAFMCQLQPHLPPADTLNAILKLAPSGVAGTLALSAGTTFKGTGYTVACERGVVTLRRENEGVVVSVCDRDDVETSRTFTQQGNGVVEEVRSWAEGIERIGECGGEEKTGGEARLAPDEALKDLEIVSDACFLSGLEVLDISRGQHS